METTNGGSQLQQTEDIQCPRFAENSACPCYKFDDGNVNMIIILCPSIHIPYSYTTPQLDL